MKRLFLLWIVFIPLETFGQQFPHPSYPQNAFRNPLDIPILLAGGYGEIRPAHFHEGLDIKTNGRIGYPVHAAAAGYISRISVSNGGYGHAVYITHPNGYTTVYGHLHRFAPEVARYVKQKQYEQQSWAINLDFSPDLFPVRQGQMIAWSGSTGAAAGPHVHFEIRNSKSEAPLNGMLFGLQIKDDIPPQVYRVSLYDMNRSIYAQEADMVDLHTAGGVYVPAHPVIPVKADKVGFGVQAVDRMNSTHNSYGIYEEVLYADGKPQIGFQLDGIGYDKTRYVDAHTDYKTSHETGRHFELLFSLPGNQLPIYHDFGGNGAVDLTDGKVHQIKITVTDASGNTSTIRFGVQKEAGGTPPAPCANTMYAHSSDIFENNNVQFYLSPGTLYDSICFQYRELPVPGAGYYSPVYQLASADIPLFKSYTLRLRPQRTVPDSLRDKVVIVREDTHGKRREVMPATWDHDWVKAAFTNFGNFSVQLDEAPPVITALNLQDGADLSKATEISFRIGDSGSGVTSYRATLDGHWLMFAQKGSTIYYTFDEHCPPGEHTLTVRVEDGVGNSSEKTYHFKR